MKTTCLFIILLSVTSLVAQQVSSEVDALVSPKRTDLVITVGGADADITGFDNKAIQFAIDAVAENGGTACPSLLKVKDSVKLYDVKVLLKTGRGMMPSFLVLPEENRRAVLAYLYELGNEAAIELMPLEEKVMAKEPIRQDTIKRYKLKAYKQLRDQFGYPG